MGDKTGIEWTDATWNPIRGCTRVSEGCRNCYAETVAARFSGPGQAYHGFADRDRAGSKWTGRVKTVWHMVDQPIRWQKPRRIFVNSMSDLFHPSLDIEELASIYAVMVAAVHLRGHTMQVLTKRPDYMRQVLMQEQFWETVNAQAKSLITHHDFLMRKRGETRAMPTEYGPNNPPPGIWLGTSVENQAAADERIPHLLATPAALRFLSCEPLLGPVDATRILRKSRGRHDRLHAFTGEWTSASTGCVVEEVGTIDWVIAGGESGPGARPMHPDWARQLRDQCELVSVPFFFKQWGEFLIAEDVIADETGNPYRDHVKFQDGDDFYVVSDHHDIVQENAEMHRGQPKQIWKEYWGSGTGHLAKRIGKKAAGALVDGREHKEFPT